MTRWRKWLRLPKSARLRKSEPYRHKWIDPAIGLALFVAALALYRRTMAPSLLDGDWGLFQYAPYALAVTYPTGYPTYILLGKLWTALWPWGSVAFRMNLLSALLGAVSVPIVYALARRVTGQRAVSAVAALFFATLPTYWFWAGVTKIYTLNIALVGLCLWLVLKPQTSEVWEDFGSLPLAALVYGLALGNHSTTLLLAPGLLLCLWLADRRLFGDGWRLARLAVLVAAPLALYLYVPLRAEQLLSRPEAVPGLTMPLAVARGLVSEYYRPTPGGVVAYFTARDFTAVVASSWADIPGQLGTYFHRFVLAEFGWIGVTLAVAGLAWQARTRPRLAAPLAVMVAAFIPFVLKYGKGEQAAFLLPTDLIITLWIAVAVAGLAGAVGRVAGGRWGRLAVVGLFAVLPLWSVATRFAALDRSSDYAIEHYWRAVLRHPLEEGAGLVAHWGDLTPLWYMQHVEGRRPDLYGLFPPTEATLGPWLIAGHPLYVAGPLQGWWPELTGGYRLTPWGRLVRVDRPDTSPSLPAPGHEADVTFGQRLRLTGYDKQGQVAAGDTLSLRLYWQTTAETEAGHLVEWRLLDQRGQPVARQVERLASAWYPRPTLPAGQSILDVGELAVPPGTPPGMYELRLAVLSPADSRPLTTPDGGVEFVVGRVAVTRPAVAGEPDVTGLAPGRGTRFGGALELRGYRLPDGALRPGDRFTVELLWRARVAPPADWAVSLQLVAADGRLVLDQQEWPVYGGYPTGGWQRGEVVRDRHELTLPARLPGGEYTLRLGLIGPDGRRLDVRRGWFARWDSLDLGPLTVEDRPHTFDVPPIPHPLAANFDHKIQLLGYGTRDTEHATRLTLYWQALAEMDTSYTVFVHVLDTSGRIVAQRDAVPGNGTLPTTGWLPGEVIADGYEVSLPPGVPPGRYTVAVGLYDAATGRRLPVRGDDGQPVADHILLAGVQVADGE